MVDIRYGIALSDTQVIPQNHRSEEAILLSGELFQIVAETEDGIFIKIYTTVQKALLASIDIYKLPDDTQYKIIDPRIWDMLIAFKNKYRRIKMLAYEKFSLYLLGLKVGDTVNVNGITLGRQWNNYSLCEIRYIGPVPEIGPGTYIGFMMLDENDTVPNKTVLSARYCDCSVDKSFIRAAEALLNKAKLRPKQADGDGNTKDTESSGSSK